jgi:hypothetical protein
MKKNNLKYTLAASLLLIVATNCTSDLENLNSNPNAVTIERFNPNYLLTTAQLNFTGDDYGNETANAQLGYLSPIVQHQVHFAWPGNKYENSPGASTEYFIKAYTNHVKYVIEVIEATREKPAYANLHQIARILKVMIFHRITDLYGDVPYFQAGKGFYDGNFTPVYDRQSQIYDNMLLELEQAAAALDASKDKPSGDLIYDGDPEKWKRLAYSMMLRLGMRLTKVDLNSAQTWVQKAAAGGVMISNEDNAYIFHEETGRPFENRMSYLLTHDYDNARWSQTLIDFLKNNDDPRLRVIAEVGSDDDPSVQIGLPNGYDAQSIETEANYPGSLDLYSRPKRSVLLKLDAPTIIQTYAEVELMLAEAKKRGWNVSGTAEEHYDLGVGAAMSQFASFDEAGEISPEDIDEYLATHPYNDANALQMINTQYWLATIFNEYETFANVRRSGFPELIPVNSTQGVTGGVIPRRLIYPLSEESSNSENYKSAIANMGGNTYLTRVWWDVE